MNSRYKSRKWIIVLMTVFLASALVYLGAVTSEAWQYVVTWTIVAYMGGNVSQKWVEAKAKEGPGD